MQRLEVITARHFWKRMKWLGIGLSPFALPRMVNNDDLVFQTGTAGVYHLMAENYGEVMDVIKALEAGTNPFEDT